MLKLLLQNRWLKYSAQVLIILAILLLIKYYKQQDIVKGFAPDFHEVLLNGQTIQLSDYRGKVLLIHFWATWCKICYLEQNSIEAISENNEIITIAINSGEAAEIKSYMDKNNLSFPVIIDEDGILAQRYGVTGVPASFIINPEGKIAYTEVGYTTNWGLRIRMWLAQD